MANNRFFEGNLPNSEMSKVYKVIVGLPSQQFVFDNGKKVVVMLPEGDEQTHPCLNSFKELTKQEAQALTSEALPV